MNLQDLMLQTYRIVGEPSDLSPNVYSPVTGLPTFDNTTVGSTALVSLLNRAYQRIGMFKDNEGKIIKFRHLNLVTYFKPINITGVVAYTQDSSAYAQITFDEPFSQGIPPDDALTGWFLQVNGEVRLIVHSHSLDFLNVGFTLDKGFSTDDSLTPGMATALFTRIVPWVNSTDPTWYEPKQSITEVQGHRIISITKITNITNNDQFLWMPTRDFRLFEYPRQQTKPTLYMPTGRGIEFNYAPLSGDIFKIEYYGAPEILAVDSASTATCSQVPTIPYAWHEVIWMMAAWIRLQEDKNFEEAAMIERNMNGLVRQLVEEGEHTWDYQNSQMVITDYNY